MSFAAVRWCEDPPKWDVLSLKDIRGEGLSVLEEADVSVGDSVNVKYGKGWFPAKIVALGMYPWAWASLSKIVW